MKFTFNENQHSPGTIFDLDAIATRSPNPFFASRNSINCEFKMSKNLKLKINRIN